MTHIVIYERDAGTPVYHRTDDLERAVAEVERLRNDNGIENAEIFELNQVAFEFKTVFKVAIEDEQPPSRSAIDLRLEREAGAPATSESTTSSELTSVNFNRRNLFAR